MATVSDGYINSNNTAANVNNANTVVGPVHNNPSTIHMNNTHSNTTNTNTTTNDHGIAIGTVGTLDT
jgi:hypothetical protein